MLQSLKIAMHPKLSVIVAVRRPKLEKLALCVSSFAALRNAGSIEIIIVSCGEELTFNPLTIQCFQNFVVLTEEPLGIYTAYNSGCRYATADYVLFFGFDDIALPGMDVLIETIDCDDTSILMYAAPCLMENRGIHAPSQLKFSILFRNWCHQGIIYLRNYLIQNPYNLDYPILADHHTNIQILSTPGISYRTINETVAFFSSAGSSTTTTDIKFRKELSLIAGRYFGSHAYILVRLKQFIDRFRNIDIPK